MHVILRGIDRDAIFFADDDYRHFRAKPSEVGAAQWVGVHAFLLMTAQSDEGVSALMKGLGQRYAQYVNRTGSL